MNNHEQSHRFDWNSMIQASLRKPQVVLILLVVVGVGLLLIFSSFGEVVPENSSSGTESAGSAVSAVTVEAELESELIHTLEAVNGAGAVNVKITLKSKHRSIWEREMQLNKRVTQEQGTVNTEESSSDQLVLAKDRDGWDHPVLKEELAPEVQGVVVVATGAGDGKIKQILTDTVITVLGIAPHRVLVIPGK